MRSDIALIFGGSIKKSSYFLFLNRNLVCVHTELVEIRKALQKAITPADRYHRELWDANKQLHENAWYVPQNVPMTTVSVATATIDINAVDMATSTTNLIHLTTNGTNPIDTSVSADQDQQLISSSCCSSSRIDLIHQLLSLTTGDDSNRHVKTESIIEDNVNLRIR